MLTGTPPFRAGSEYLIFQKITACEFEFPEMFDEDAKDLITKLLRFNPKERIGSENSSETRYCSIRKHRFFEGIKWESVRDTTPPEMKLPKKSNDSDEREDSFTISDDIEPGKLLFLLSLVKEIDLSPFLRSLSATRNFFTFARRFCRKWKIQQPTAVR